MDNRTPPRPSRQRPDSGSPAAAPRAPSPAEQRKSQRRSLVAMLAGIAGIISVMVHFFISPLNIKLQLAGNYNGTFLALLPMALGIFAVLLAISSRKALPREHEGFAIVGMITGVISLIFGILQLFTCTICVQFNLFGLNLK